MEDEKDGGAERALPSHRATLLSAHQAMNSPSTPTPPWGNLKIQYANNAEPRDVPLHGKEALVVGRADQAHIYHFHASIAHSPPTTSRRPQADIVIPVSYISSAHCNIHPDIEPGTGICRIILRDT